MQCSVFHGICSRCPATSVTVCWTCSSLSVFFLYLGRAQHTVTELTARSVCCLPCIPFSQSLSLQLELWETMLLAWLKSGLLTSTGLAMLFGETLLLSAEVPWVVYMVYLWYISVSRSRSHPCFSCDLKWLPETLFHNTPGHRSEDYWPVVPSTFFTLCESMAFVSSQLWDHIQSRCLLKVLYLCFSFRIYR